tara:strand:+ start:9244 stop:9399 length:156 start_codon:yes stop_codon:yes gene_type:complete
MPSNKTDAEIQKQVDKIEKMFQDAFDEVQKPKRPDVFGKLLNIARRGNGSR